MLQQILENLLAKSDLLIIFIGMALLQWRVVSALDALAQLLAQYHPSAPQSVSAIVPVPAAKPQTAPSPSAAKPAVVIDPGLVAAVKKFEGFQAHAYADYKQYSIGYGTKATSSSETITEAEATTRLETELAAADQSVEKFAPNSPLGVKQALTSLTYNAGPIWQQQTLGTEIKAGNYEQAKTSFVAYNHAGGVVNSGLTARRDAEVKWFDNPL